MKNLTILILAVLCWSACKNSSNQNTTPATGVTTENKEITSVDVLQASAKAKTAVEDLKGIISDLDNLPETAKEQNKEMFETLKQRATEFLEKQTTLVSSLETAGSNLSNGNMEEVKSMITQTNEMARHMDGFRSRIEQMRSGERR
jgi:soluble cytochrome b562